MAKKPNQKNEAALVAQQVVTDSHEQKSELCYVVLREGHRVSDNEYKTQDDPKAISEMEWWRTIAQNHSWGEPVEIVQYDNKLHRVW